MRQTLDSNGTKPPLLAQHDQALVEVMIQRGQLEVISNEQETVSTDIADPLGAAASFAQAGRDALARMIDDDRAILTGLLDAKNTPDGRARSITTLRHGDTDALLQQVRKKWGDNLHIAEHPQQPCADWIGKLDRLSQSLDTAKTAQFKSLAGRYADLMSATAPGAKIRHNPSSVARMAGGLFFNETTPTVESVDAPATQRVNASAESLRWNYDHWRDEAMLAINNAFDEISRKRFGPMEYRYGDGSTVHITSRLHRRRFYRATVDYLRRLDAHARGIHDQPEAPEPIRTAAKAVAEYTRRISGEGRAVGMLDELDPARVYLPRRWKHWAIAADRANFVEKLIDQNRTNRTRDYYTGKPIDIDTIEVSARIVDTPRRGNTAGLGLNAEDRSAIRELLDQNARTRAAETRAAKKAQPTLGPQPTTKTTGILTEGNIGLSLGPDCCGATGRNWTFSTARAPRR